MDSSCCVGKLAGLGEASLGAGWVLLDATLGVPVGAGGVCVVLLWVCGALDVDAVAACGALPVCWFV